ncbi:hypothetical protein DI270_000520 [Microbispora triticiradicis]|uniref:Uncharacterized protein n=1 Tax=Microbispora triticiradicis TaxID=2200763 RepID=A0ABX9LSK7_9ACTN|nr:hypothetical protein [Microbispora triticiradicis]RGA06981.1 hypothetical protein DI270_000520 [Microbispora triticiradicis]GLW22925.1 hypothetical protein Mame01_29680 [Microbispora amethystogenes]
MPGVNIVTATRSGPGSNAQVVGARYFVVGLAERGPADRAVPVRSLAQFTDVFGDRVSYSYLYDDIRTHFEEGGVEAVVARVVGPAASVATVSLNDRAGSPLATLTVNAANPGAWGVRVQVTIRDGAATGTHDLLVYFDGRLVESFLALGSPAAAVTATAQSAYIRVVNQGSTTTAPNNNGPLRDVPAPGTP